MQSKNRYRDRSSDLSETRVRELAKESVSHEEELWFPLTEKSYGGKSGLKVALSMKLSDHLSNLFMYYRKLFELDRDPTCYYCDRELGPERFAYSERVALDKGIGYDGLRESGFAKYCESCQEDEVWKRADHPDRDTDEIAEKISESRKEWAKTEEGREFYEKQGRRNSRKLKEFYDTEKGRELKKRAAEKQSETMRRKVRDGEFTPPVNNRFTSWDAEIEFPDGTVRSYRSSWEACMHLSNPELNYESVRIPYQDESGKDRVYIADFEDPETGRVIEIKPKKYWMKQSDKMDQIIRFCRDNGRPFTWVNEHNISEWIDEDDFLGFEKNVEQLNKLKNGIQ